MLLAYECFVLAVVVLDGVCDGDGLLGLLSGVERIGHLFSGFN